MTAVSQPVPYRVLVVCTGNICRSPFTEQLLREAFARIGNAAQDSTWAGLVEISSAGTHAMVGSPIEPAMAVFLESSDAGVSEHAARQLEVSLLASADLVLALTRDHRRDIVRLLPAASRRVFTVNEFARLLEDANAAGVLALDPTAPAPLILGEVADAVASRRGFALMPDDPAVDDVTDPFRRDDAVYRASAAQMIEIVGRIESSITAALGAER